MPYCVKIVIEEQEQGREPYDEWHIIFDNDYVKARVIADDLFSILVGLSKLSKLKIGSQ
jgi:hypothetical protein